MKDNIIGNEDKMLELIETLVNIDSGTYVKHGVDKVGKVLLEEYESIGFQAEIDEQEIVGNNLLIRHPEVINPQILIIAHMDTVFKEGTVAERTFRREGDYAYGPGVIDMKSSQVTTLFALKALIESGSNAYKNVEIILNTDEEIGSIYSRDLIERTAKDKKYALILEPAQNGNLVSERKGGGKYLLKITGKSSHAGIAPENGVSAIEELGNKIIKLHKLTNRDEGINVNVGIVKGGTSVNTIAPYAEASIDVRINTAEQGDAIDKAIKEICSKSDVPGTTLELSGKITRPAWVLTEESQKLIDIIADEGKKLGLELSHEKSGGGSDGNITGYMGIPSIDGLGPEGGNAHEESEFLYIPSLTVRTNLLANVIQRLSNQ
nr:M20 family metallopeptidase [Fredinandcohnia onubensis]